MIKKWHLKAGVQKSISFLPHKNDINFWFQKNITKGVELTDQYFTYKIQAAKDHIDFENRFVDKNSKTALELGTGWYPIVPIYYFLIGYEKTYSLDLSNWLTEEYIYKTISKYIEWRNNGMLASYLSHINEEKWSVLEELNLNRNSSIETLCNKLNFEPIIGDARTTKFENNTFHLISSNNTFEHIYPDVLKDILKEFKRIIKPSGIMSHFIDMSDHFSHLDNTISNFNFLKYSDKAWNIIDNSIQPQNRLRFKDYLEMYHDLELNVVETKTINGNLEDLKNLKLSQKFRAYTREQLAITHGYIVSKSLKVS